MGTRSLIGILKEENLVDYIYCHWDGYPSHTGRILLENYATEDRVLELIEQGNMSFLGESIEGSIFYGEPGCEDVDIVTIDELVDYIYLYHKQSGKWMYCMTGASYSLLTKEAVA